MRRTLEKERKDALPYLEVSSAGTNVDRARTNTEDPARVAEILGAGLEYRVVPESIDREVRDYVALIQQKGVTDLRAGDIDRLKDLHGEVRPRLRARAVQDRDDALRQRGIDVSLGEPRQFRPEDRYDLVVPMDGKTLISVRDLYMAQGVKAPLIVPYAQLVGGDEVREIFTGRADGALEHVDYFMATKDRAIDGMLNALKAK